MTVMFPVVLPALFLVTNPLSYSIPDKLFVGDKYVP